MKCYEHPDITEVSLETVMHALSDPCRLKIVKTLIEANGDPIPCNKFMLDVSKSTVSHHFDVLRNAGITRTETQGTKCMTTLRGGDFELKFPGITELVAKEFILAK